MTFSGFSKAFRWNDGVDTERYSAVELRDEGLVYYQWSHVHGEGRTDEVAQSFPDFRDNGPLRPVPEAVRIELEQLVRDRM